MECDLTCNRYSSTAVFTNNGGGWTTNIDTAACNEGLGMEICFDDNDDTIPIGSIVSIGINNDFKIPSPEWEWVTKMQIESTDTSLSIEMATDCCGNVFVSGLFDASITMYNSDTTTLGYALSTFGATDMFVGKLNTRGIWEWVVQIASGDDDTSTSIATDKYGNSYAACSVSDSATFYNADGTEFGTMEFPIGMPSDATMAVLGKLNPNGHWVWITRIASEEGTLGNNRVENIDIAIDNCNNLYVCGEYRRNVLNFYNIDGTLEFTRVLGNVGVNADIFIAKLLQSGTWEWSAGLTGGLGELVAVTAMRVDCCSNVYITFRFASTTVNFRDLDDSIPISIDRISSSDACIGKLSFDGRWKWGVKLAGTDAELTSSIGLDCRNNVYIIQQFESNLLTLYDNNDNPTNFVVVNSGISNDNDVVIAKVNSDGIWQWIARITGESSELEPNLITDCCGNSYCVINSQSSPTMLYNVDGSLAFTMTSGGNNYGLIGKISTNGTWQWGRRIFSVDNTPGTMKLVVGHDCCGNVYVGGRFESTTITFMGDGPELTLNSDTNTTGDYFMAKLHNDTCYPGVSVDDNCAIFRGTVQATNQTTTLPVQIGKHYYYNRITNKLELTCNPTGCCRKFYCPNCIKLNACNKLYAIGLPNDEMYIL